jgi:mannan endo-1,4-beta-mannosidase
VRYLREEKQLRHLLFAYSPDLFESEAQYLERYPGDEYVDLLGLDDYGDVGLSGDPAQLRRRLRMVAEMAEARGKLAALTETGQERVPQADWWTRVLIGHIEEDSLARGICYALVWRNDRKEHFYGPVVGHPSAEDFRAYFRHPASWFAGDVRGLYRRRAAPRGR